MRYPVAAFNAKVQGRIIITFVVEKDGTLSNIKVLRGIGSSCDEEAIRAIKACPPWLPGMQKGKPVRVQYSVPIAFSLGK
ncbi:energy transducer TonB [Mucilaginibacter psychrotolerans]|uniref:energy transducer TonB n=1 Tax=Mucilaginibacter psychrotolerans TaxID=1524096 RepID=UPI0021D2DBFC|nr:energy transducer TonB [Mucilaginibacter psychrotolerans]